MAESKTTKQPRDARTCLDRRQEPGPRYSRGLNWARSQRVGELSQSVVPPARFPWSRRPPDPSSTLWPPGVFAARTTRRRRGYVRRQPSRSTRHSARRLDASRLQLEWFDELVDHVARPATSGVLLAQPSDISWRISQRPLCGHVPSRYVRAFGGTASGAHHSEKKSTGGPCRGGPAGGTDKTAWRGRRSRWTMRAARERISYSRVAMTHCRASSSAESSRSNR